MIRGGYVEHIILKILVDSRTNICAKWCFTTRSWLTSIATIEDVRTAESEEEVEEPVSNAIDNDTLEDREEMEVDEDSAYDMDGGVLEADDADYDFSDQDANEHDTNLIDANVMNNDNDEPEGRIRSIRRKVLPARLKECMF